MAKKPYSPADKIAEYNQIVSDRGYSFFSPQSMAAHKEKYGEKSHAEIRSDARAKHQAFKNTCTNIHAPNHAQDHNTLMTKFGGDQDAAFENFLNEEKRNNGRLPEQYPQRNNGYEKRTLDAEKPRKFTTFEEKHNYETLDKLMKAKWNAVGYEGDGAAILEFNLDYAHKAV